MDALTFRIDAAHGAPAPEPALGRWARLAGQSLDGAAALVTLLEGSRHVVRGVAGRFEHLSPGPALLAEGGACTLLLAHAGPLAIGDTRTDPRCRDLPRGDPDHPAALAGAAIRDRLGRPVGTLCVVADHPRLWTDRELELLGGLADAVGLQLDLERESQARQRAEAAVQRADAKFRAVFENTALGIALIATDGWLIRTNPALQRMLGESEESLRTRRFTDFVHPDDLQPLTTALERITLQTHGCQQLEQRFLLSSGQVLWGNVMASAIRDRQGRPLCGVALVEDITQRKVAEDALRESQRQLLFSQRLEAVGRLAGGIAHDFNNMLTAIGSFAQLLALELELPEEPARYVAEIQKASARAATLTRQLLAFSRQQVLKPQRLSLNQVVWELEGMLRRLIGEHVELATDLDLAPEPVWADPGQVEQVIMNLVVNARDAMPQGGRITISIHNADLSREEARSYPYAVLPGRYTCLTVSDTGTGMDEETLSRIFEPFFTTKEQGKGTGLGLSTVYGIVKQSGGYVWAHSELGQGTTIRVLLPALPGAAPEEPERASGEAEEVRGGTETVLLVEDEEVIRSLAERILVRQGYTVLSAGSGAEALQLLDEKRVEIDLLLTDVVMPGMSGRALAQRLLARAPKLRVLYVSGYTADALRQHGVLDSGIALLDKPFTPEVLARAVRRVLDGG